MEASCDDSPPPPEKARGTDKSIQPENVLKNAAVEKTEPLKQEKSEDHVRPKVDITSPGIAEEEAISDFHHSAIEEKDPSSTDQDYRHGKDTIAPGRVDISPSKPVEKASVQDKAPGSRSHKLQKFSLYETQARYYLVGSDIVDTQYRILNIDRRSPPGQLNIVEDEVVYTKKEIYDLLSAIDHGNRAAGGMKLKGNCWGLLGFIRFTDAYYMLTVTKRQQVAMIGGYFIYQVDGTELVPLTTGNSSVFQTNRNADEIRYLGILNNLDLNRSFYFSYSYNITRSLQYNIIKGRNFLSRGLKPTDQHDINNMFVWNSHLLNPAVAAMKNPYDWCLPIIHGFIDQSSVNCFGRNIYITLIARRSRHFAGARFLKRGANDQGYVANDVETEQIVADMSTTSFSGPGPYPMENANYTSFVQHRGSIPLYWTQDNSGVSPKPAIDLNVIDPFYASAALHFDHLFERYCAPITVLNLVKARERTPRESKLLVEYQNAINYLNQSLPEGKKILYRGYDMARAAKTRGQDVIGTLEEIARELVRSCGFFHNSNARWEGGSTQNGVTRSNCIDCLDRTNAAQFVVGKAAFALQLQALGLIAEDSINYDSDASNLFAHMFNDHGDTLASQYGGSHLVNTTDSYRKINNWQSHSRDMLESFKRYYHNSFLDSQRQEAYNLFLGNYVFSPGQPMLWDLPNDYYLHHAIPSSWAEKSRRDYINWFTPAFLDPRILSKITNPEYQQTKPARLSNTSAIESEWWQDYYRPQFLSFQKSFSYRINSTMRYLPKQDPSRYNMSPFCVRKAPYEIETPDKKHPKEVAVTDANSRIISPLSATSAPHNPAKRIASLQAWLHPASEKDVGADGAGQKGHLQASTTNAKQRETSEAQLDDNFKPADKASRNQWTLRQFHANSLHPTVTTDEAKEYERYISHPLRLPLVVSNDVPAADETSRKFAEYLAGPKIVCVEDDTIPMDLEHGYGKMSSAEIAEFEHWMQVLEDPLTVTEEDGEKKRYRAYRKWLVGKSLFKQSKDDPEHAGAPRRT